MFVWNSLAFLMIQRMLAIWSLVPLPFLKPAWTSEISQFMYCWGCLEKIPCYLSPAHTKPFIENSFQEWHLRMSQESYTLAMIFLQLLILILPSKIVLNKNFFFFTNICRPLVDVGNLLIHNSSCWEWSNCPDRKESNL